MLEKPIPIFTLDPKNNLLYINLTSNNKTIWHKHQFYEIVFIAKGSSINCIENSKYELSQGDFSLILPNEKHMISSSVNSSQWDICIQKEFFENYCNCIDSLLLYLITKDKKHHKFKLNKSSTQIIQQKIDSFSINQPINNNSTKIIISSILSEIFSAFIEKNYFSPTKEPEWLKVIKLRFQDIHYLQKGIQGIIEDINYNQIYINRVFKKYEGTSIGNYLNKTRLQISLNYLKTSDLSIENIAYLLGFSSQSFFYKQFHKVYGLTPGEYRANILANNLIEI